MDNTKITQKLFEKDPNYTKIFKNWERMEACRKSSIILYYTAYKERMNLIDVMVRIGADTNYETEAERIFVSVKIGEMFNNPIAQMMIEKVLRKDGEIDKLISALQ